MTPFGQSLVEYHRGNYDAKVLIRRDDGFTAPLPASYFFRQETDFSASEKLALSLCKGQVLDIGAGSGIHSLFLQKKGFRVTSLDISPELVSLLAERGVENPVLADIFNYHGGPFDTLLMLGHGIGICGTLEGLDKFLILARNLVNPGGQIILDSTDASKSADPQNLAYHEANRKAGRYIGDVCFRMEFGEIIGPYFHWLHVDPSTLDEHAQKAGWSFEIIMRNEHGEYLARLNC